MVHDVNHATQHHSGDAPMLTDLGRSPGNLARIGTLSKMPIDAHICHTFPSRYVRRVKGGEGRTT